MNKSIFIPALFLLLISCTADLSSYLQKNNVEPVITKPVIFPFEKDNNIIIKWEADIGADEYILYKSESPNGIYNKIYEGPEKEFMDYVGGYEKGKFFYYKLSKKRESKIFDKSDYSCGVVAEMSNDNWEENNDKNHVKNIDGNNLIYATLWIYRDNFGHTIVDNDYYSISVDNNMFVLLRLNFENKPQGTSWDNYVYLCSSYSDKNGETVTENIDFKLYNTYNKRQELTFQLQPNKEDILGNPDEPGMQCISYSLSNMGFKAISPQN